VSVLAVPPCPSWCTEPVGHNFAELARHGDTHHTGHVTQVQWLSSLVGGACEASVAVSRTDHVSDAGIVEQLPAGISLIGLTELEDDLTASEARALGAALLAAADRLDGINGTLLNDGSAVQQHA
jgi:hypothetical protein